MPLRLREAFVAHSDDIVNFDIMCISNSGVLGFFEKWGNGIRIVDCSQTTLYKKKRKLYFYLLQEAVYYIVIIIIIIYIIKIAWCSNEYLSKVVFVHCSNVGVDIST